MKFFRSQSFDPAYNLALEQFLFETKKPGEGIVLLWQNDNAVVVGRYQNVFEEVDIDYADKIGAKIVRRMTGGGAVYHDLGNLNYSFIVGTTDELTHCQEAFLHATLKKLGIKYELVGRNDILVNGAKISGCAECREDGKILHHGTLLINSNLNVLGRILTRNNKISSRSVKSKPRKVMNLSDFMAGINVESVIKTFSEIAGEKISDGDGFEEESFFGEIIKDSQQIAEILKGRYGNDKWTYGFPPKYKYRNSRCYETGQVCVNVDIRDSLISDIKFSGDFMALQNVHELENRLKGLLWSSNNALKQFLVKYGNGYILGLQGSDIALLFDKFMIGDALAMVDNIAIIKQAHKLLTEEHFLIKYSAELNNSDFSGITEDERTAALRKLQNVRQDFTKIMVTMNSIDRAYKWYQTNNYPYTYHESMGEQARDDLGCLIEFLFAKYRVILEYTQFILETLLPPVLKQTDVTEYQKCKKPHEKFKWLTKYISEHYNNNSGLMDTGWFQDLRETRNALIHRGASCLVFGDKERLLFNIYTPESVQSDEEIIEEDDFYTVGRNNLVSYDRYWGIYFAKLIVFTNAILEFVRSISTLPAEREEIIRYAGLDKPTELGELDGEKIPGITDIPANLLKSLFSD